MPAIASSGTKATPSTLRSRSRSMSTGDVASTAAATASRPSSGASMTRTRSPSSSPLSVTASVHSIQSGMPRGGVSLDDSDSGLTASTAVLGDGGGISALPRAAGLGAGRCVPSSAARPAVRRCSTLPLTAPPEGDAIAGAPAAATGNATAALVASPSATPQRRRRASRSAVEGNGQAAEIGLCLDDHRPEADGHEVGPTMCATSEDVARLVEFGEHAPARLVAHHEAADMKVGGTAVYDLKAATAAPLMQRPIGYGDRPRGVMKTGRLSLSRLLKKASAKRRASLASEGRRLRTSGRGPSKALRAFRWALRHAQAALGTASNLVLGFMLCHHPASATRSLGIRARL
jgi:hypothetical protein